MYLKEIKNIFHLELDTIYTKEEVNSFFYMLIEHFLGLERFILALEPNLIISKEEENPLFEALSRLKIEIPIQHIIGKTNFMDLEFIVDKNVLIPRPETEDLVRWILKDIKDNRSEINILDIGTGSGCIPITLKKQLPNAKVFALDISANILEIEKLDQKFDIIVSNPPYVRELEKNEMQKNVLKHEPGLALFVSDEDPLLFYKKIVEFALQNLKNNGAVYFEINQYLGKETQQLLDSTNFYDIELRQDIFGNDRMLKGIKK